MVGIRAPNDQLRTQTAADPIPDPDAPPAAGPSWWICASAGIAILACYGLMPTLMKDSVYDLFSLFAAVALGVAARRSTGSARLAWSLFAIGQAFYTIAEVLWNVTNYRLGEVPTPSYLDGLYLANYPITGLGLLVLARARRVSRGWETATDVITAGIAGALIIWMLLPSLFNLEAGSLGETIVNFAYPAGDLILIVLVVRLAIGPGSHGPSLWLLLLGNVFIIIADIIFAAFNARGSFPSGTYLDTIWQVGYLTLALAALHPSARYIGLSDPTPPRSLLYRRIAFLLLAGLLPPILFGITVIIGEGPDLAPFAIGSVALYLAMLSRVYFTVRQEEKNVREETPSWIR